MEENKKSKGFIWLIAILIVLILGLVGYIVYDKVLKVEKTNKENSTTTLISTTNKNIKNKVIERKSEITFNDLVELLKDYYINQEKQDGISDFYDENNVEKWDIENIEYLGYYEDNENIKYYVANGNFKCKDNGYTCIYMEQVDYDTTDIIPFKAIFAIKQTDNKYSLDHMDSQSFDYFVKGESVSADGFVLVEKEIIKISNQISLSNYPEKNDDGVIVLGDLYDNMKKSLNSNDYKKIENGDNFKNISFKIKDNSFDLFCNEYSYEYESCIEKSVNIDNKIKVSFEDQVGYLGVYTIITDKYYIIQTGNSITHYGQIYIYDKNGNELLKTDPTTFYNEYSLETKNYATIFENKLYYIKHANCTNTLSYIDLEDINFKMVELDSKSTEGANEC